MESVAVRDGEYRSTPWKLSSVKCINLVGLKTNRSRINLLIRSQKDSFRSDAASLIASLVSRAERRKLHNAGPFAEY